MAQLYTIILAAGKGVRMKSKRPKVLHSLCGRPMLSYVLDLARAARSLKTFVVLGHQYQAVRQILPQGIQPVHQTRLLGTGDAIKRVIPRMRGYRGDVLILCGDVPLLRVGSLRTLLKTHRRQKADCTMLTARLSNPRGYGRIIRDRRGDVVAIREQKDASPAERRINEINTGVYCFKADVLRRSVGKIRINKKKKEFYLTDIIALLNQQGKKLSAVCLADPLESLGINSRADLAEAETAMRRRINQAHMVAGVTIVDPLTTYIDTGVKIGRDTVIRPCCVIETGVRIGRDCIIGPYCHLRTETVIGNETEIGNHTEVSRTTVGANCFVKHFSFLGDARLGRHVNIGAGVVTANFDGKEKHITTIRDHAFIGSDSILVAPTKIGKSAKTAAGCVVTGGTVVPARGAVAGVPAKPMRRSKKE